MAGSSPQSTPAAAMRNKGVIRIFILVVICTGVFFTGKLIMETNERYPQPPVTIHSMNKSITVPGTEGISFKVESVSCLTKDETASRLPESYLSTKKNFDDLITLVIMLEVKNESGEQWA
jgi:hypothetical protein